MSIFLNQAQENERFLKSLDEQNPSDFYDWKITVCFYVCLHYVNILMEKKFPIYKNESHQDKLDFLKQKSRRHIYEEYRELYSLCLDGRYDGFEDFSYFKEQNKINYNSIARPTLNTIKKYILDAIES